MARKQCPSKRARAPAARFCKARIPELKSLRKELAEAKDPNAPKAVKLRLKRYSNPGCPVVDVPRPHLLLQQLPTAAGLASSASGFAALVSSLAKLYEPAMHPFPALADRSPGLREAVCKTVVPDTAFVGSGSVRFVVDIELAGMLVLPAAMAFTRYFIVVSIIPGGTDTTIPLILLAIVLGLPGVLIVVTSREIAYIGWMLVYLLSTEAGDGIHERRRQTTLNARIMISDDQGDSVDQ
ncbi:hypothetical protein BDZ89DRAFT_1149789 [Hymenopellis radicata]|nr:hypothetical protein BDZ89DRAFT_1149789 [Hymenopellis radicata]